MKWDELYAGNTLKLSRGGLENQQWFGQAAIGGVPIRLFLDVEGVGIRWGGNSLAAATSKYP